MSSKHPTWTRSRVGRNRVHWVAYDDRLGSDSGPPRIVDQGYATSLPEADAAARAALADAGMYQARRMSKGFGSRAASSSARPDVPKPKRPKRPAGFDPTRPRQYLYTRTQDDPVDGPLVAAHLVVKKTPRRVYVTRRACGPDQIGTEEERWEPEERTIALDRSRLERDGSVYSVGHRQSDFFATREAAMGDPALDRSGDFRALALHPPCTIDEIKAAYRRRAFEVHPDRGGSPADFQAVESAYRRLLREAQGPES